MLWGDKLPVPYTGEGLLGSGSYISDFFEALCALTLLLTYLFTYLMSYSFTYWLAK